MLADGTTPPDWVAMDLFSQAEHDELAQSILLCPDAAYIARCSAESTACCPTMPRAEIIRASLEGRGALIHTALAWKRPARHQQPHRARAPGSQQQPDPHRWEPLLRHAGAIFLGAYTSESLGDYCAGPNHVLPTSGTARFSSPLGCTTSEAQQPDRGERSRRAGAGPDRCRAGLWRRAAGPCAGGGVPAEEISAMSLQSVCRV